MRGHILYLESGVSIHFCNDCMVTHPFICSLLSEETRIHSSRMRTARGSSRQLGGCFSACWDTPPQVWAWRTPLPLGMGLEDPPPGVGLETPLARPLKLPPPGVDLETSKACWHTPPRDLQGMLAYPQTTPCKQNHRHV